MSGLTSRAACAAGGAERTQIDVERAVRNQLYGERSELTDLGLACRAGEEAPKYCGEVAGTYGYMAPEVLRGGTVSPLSDLYSLGALAYRLLGGPPERRSAAAAKLSAVWRT